MSGILVVGEIGDRREGAVDTAQLSGKPLARVRRRIDRYLTRRADGGLA